MYTSYFGFREKPFNVAADPRFFYSNPAYREAYSTVLYGIRERRGFILLTGEVGAGKTTILRRLMDNLEGTVRFVFFYNTTLTFEELLSFICEELGLSVKRGGRLRKIQTLNEFLIAQLKKGGTGVLLIDEAQNLGEEVLENLRLLSNLEAGSEKLLQIVLVGQPELENKLAQPGLRQVLQRIAVRYRLDRLKDQEVGPFIDYRLRAVGYKDHALFSPEAVQQIGFYSKGIPRLINILCDNALLIAFGASEKKVSAKMIEEVAQDLRLRKEAEVTQIALQAMLPSTDGKERGTKPTRTGATVRGDGQVPLKEPVSSPDASLRLGILRTPLQPDAVSQFIGGMTKALAEAMGPMAPLVVRDQIAILGESLHAFPKGRLDELVELVSREILHEKLKSDFQRMMHEEIHSLLR